MPLTARQLRQPPTIEAIKRVPYFADIGNLLRSTSLRFPLMSTLRLRNLPDSTNPGILPNFTNIRFPLIPTKDLKIPLNPINQF